MRRTNVRLALPLLAAVAGLIWFAFGRTPRSVSIGDGTNESADDATAPDALSPDGMGGLVGGAGVRPKPPQPVALGPTFRKSDGVFGRVTDARDAPIPGAKVTLERLDPATIAWWQLSGEALFTADTAADGTYLVGPISPGAFRWRVRAEAPGFARGGADVPSKGARIDLQLERSGTLEIEVRDLTGAPVANAVVRAGPDSPFERVTGVTDVAGLVRIEGLPLGGMELTAECLGYSSAISNDAVVSADAPVRRTIVLRAAIRIAGKVLDDATGAPIARATVTASSGYGGPSALVAATTTDTEGNFSLEPPGRANTSVEVVARKAGLGSSATMVELRASARAGIAAGPGTPTIDVLLRLGKPSAISGVVVDADARPVADAIVVFANAAGLRGFGEAAARTDGEGRFTLEMPPGTNRDGSLTIAAYAPGKGLGVATIIPNQTPSALVRLLGTGSVVGTIRAPDGAGAEGAVIRLYVDHAKRPDLPAATAEFDPSQYAQAVDDPRLATVSVSSDAEGRFRFESIPTGSHFAVVSWKGTSSGTPTPVSVRPGGVSTVDVTLKSGAVIEGRVVDAEAKPVAGARITAWDPASDQPTENRFARARSDADGRFALRGVRGLAWSLEASATGFLTTTKEVRVGDKDVEIRMSPLGWVDGVVLGSDGKPFGGSFDATAAPAAGAEEQEGSQGSFSSGDGTFRLRGLAAGPYVVSATTAEGLVPAVQPSVNVVNGAGAGPVEVRLVHGASISGTVSEDGSRRPLENAAVSIRIQGEPSSGGRTESYGTTDAKGRFAALGLAGGTYRLVVTDSGGGSYEEAIPIDPGQTVEREIVTRRPGAIAVRVVDVDGHPVAKARVMLRLEGGAFIQPNWDALRREGKVDFGRGGWELAMSTNDDGRLTRWHVPPGRVSVMVRTRAAPMRHEPITVTVTSDRTTEVTIKVSPDDGTGR